ncbi:MAG: lipopolysaccharide biosynthesis protein [Thermoanaerobaculia bacterium]
MSLRILSKDFAFYGLLDFLQRSLGILLVPIYTRVLSQASYGDLDLIVTVGSALTVLVDLQFAAAFGRLYLEHRRDADGPRFVGTTILTRAAVGTVLAALFLSVGFAGGLETRFIPSFAGNAAAWVIVALSVPVTFVYDILLVQTQMLRSKKGFFVGAFGNALLATILSIVFTVALDLGIFGVVLGQFIGRLVVTLVLLMGMRKEIAFEYRSAILTELSSYALPLVPGWWVAFSSAYVSRFFIYGGQGAQQNAILAITMKLAALIGMFCVAFRTAWQPLAISYIGEDGGEAFYIQSLRVFTAAGLFSVFMLALLSRPALAILAPPSYGAAADYVPYFLVAMIIGELDVNLQLGNQISKKTHWMSIAATLGLVVNLAVLISWTSRLGIYAAGAGLLASVIMKVSVTYLSAQRNYKIHYDRKSLIVFAFGCVSLLLLAVARSTAALGEAVVVGMVLVLGLALPWIALGRRERDLFRKATAVGVSWVFGGRGHADAG